MSYFLRNKGWAIAFLLLIALNVATLLTFWLVKERKQRPPAHPSGVVEFLSTELSFDSTQRMQLMQLLEDHQQQMRTLGDNRRDAKDAFFSLLKENNISDAAIDSAAALTARYDAQTDVLTFRHFRKIRALCTPQQQDKFDRIIQEVLRMLAPPPGGRPGPPSGQERPAPPPGREEP